MRGFDIKDGWQIDAEILKHAKDTEEYLTSHRASRKRHGISLRLVELSKPLADADIDVEYAVRAWCALERCFLPSAPHRDVRIVQLIQDLKQLQMHASKLQKEMLAHAKDSGADAGATESESVETSNPLSSLMNSLYRLESMLSLCAPNETNRKFYMNAWVYAYLKRHVLTITNPADYQYLDGLMVTESTMHQYGTLYLAAIADNTAPLRTALEALGEQRPSALLEPRVYFPPNHTAFTLTLEALLGSMSSTSEGVKEGEWYDSFEGSRLAKVTAFILEKKRCNVHLSDAGFLGASPSTTELEVRWQGSRSSITALVVKVIKNRPWSLEDRVQHEAVCKAIQLHRSLNSTGLSV